MFPIISIFSSIPNISYKLLDSIEINQNIGTKCVNAWSSCFFQEQLENISLSSTTPLTNSNQ